MNRQSQYRGGVNPGIISAGTAAIQRKLTIGGTNNMSKNQANKIMRMPETSFVQRKAAGSCGEYDDEHVRLKRAPFIQTKGADGGTASDAVSSKIKDTKGGGTSMADSTKSFMENSFGSDFSDVRIHTGDYAAQMSNELNAQAFTVGSDIYFNSGKYAPGASDGKHLLAHELTHVVQQSGSIERKIQRQEKPKDDYKACTTTQKGLIDTALANARKKVEAATRVTAVSWGNPDKISPRVKQLFMDHFHTVKRSDLRDILSKYVSLGQSLAKGIEIQCENTCDKGPDMNTCGYAYNNQLFGGHGAVHICFDPAGCDFTLKLSDQQIKLLIHEAAHRYTGVDDKAYRWKPEYSKLTPDQAMDNADSYAWFATLL